MSNSERNYSWEAAAEKGYYFEKDGLNYQAAFQYFMARIQRAIVEAADCPIGKKQYKLVEFEGVKYFVVLKKTSKVKVKLLVEDAVGDIHYPHFGDFAVAAITHSPAHLEKNYWTRRAAVRLFFGLKKFFLERGECPVFVPINRKKGFQIAEQTR